MKDRGSVISGALTALAAIFAMFFAGKKFSGQIKNLEAALSKSQDLLKAHEKEVGERDLTALPPCLVT
jgi:hypothetical protein